MQSTPAFRWHPAARVVEHAKIAADQIATLKVAVMAGAEFRVSASGITPVPDGCRGFLQCASSGTTAAPKVIRRRHVSWIDSFEVNARRFGFGPDDRFAVLGDISHSLALYGVIEAAHLGADIHALAALRPDRQAAALTEHRVSVIYATPSQLGLIAGGGVRLLSVRHILCGGGLLDPAVRGRISRCFPNAHLTEFYGASETSFITMTDAATPPLSVGRAYDGVELSIADPSDDIGTVWVRSPYLFDGYAEGSSIATRWHNGWVTVGEMGWLDADGYLFLAGRRDRMITIADQNVFPEELEAVLRADPSAPICAVLPVADPRRGQTLVAIVAGRADAALSDRLVARCRATLGPLKSPRRVLFHPEFPTLPSGKPDLRALADWLGAQT